MPNVSDTPLRLLRERAGLSQSQLAAASDISVRVLQNYEQGVRDLNGAKLLTLLQLCTALGCNLGELITDQTAIALLQKMYPSQ